MAEKYSIVLLGIMDQLWFHQIILFSKTPSISIPENPLPIQDSLASVETENTLVQVTKLTRLHLIVNQLNFSDSYPTFQLFTYIA